LEVAMRVRIVLLAVLALVAVNQPITAWAADKVESEKWAGYVAQGEPGAFDSITAEWEVPKVDCEEGEVSDAAVWIGIDGANNSFVEQVGTSSECGDDGPNYFAWAERYPQPAEQLFHVNPGDQIEASVEVDAGANTFRFSLRDKTRNKHDQDTWHVDGPAASVEAVVEAPPGFSLAEFKDPVQFRDVKVDGEKIGELGDVLERYVMVQPRDHDVVRAKATKLTNKKDFDVVWKAP
jgi:hypothetical protein